MSFSYFQWLGNQPQSIIGTKPYRSISIIKHRHTIFVHIKRAEHVGCELICIALRKNRLENLNELLLR